MTSPLVTVVIPCYRQAHYLPAAIESVLAQSYANIEAVVVNDGSDDDTDGVAARYVGRIRYVKKRNGGPSSARNAGIREARGEYLHFLDADDVLHLDAIRRLVDAVKGRVDTCGVMGFRRFTIDPARDAGDEQYPPGDFMPGIFHSYLYAPIFSWLIPRERITRVGGFDESVRGFEDWDLWLRLALADVQCSRVAFAGAYYRDNPHSASKDKRSMGVWFVRVFASVQRRVSRSPDLAARFGSILLAASATQLRAGLSRGLSEDDLVEIESGISLLIAAGAWNAEVRRDLRDCRLWSGGWKACKGNALQAIRDYSRAARLGASPRALVPELLKLIPRSARAYARRALPRRHAAR